MELFRARGASVLRHGLCVNFQRSTCDIRIIRSFRLTWCDQCVIGIAKVVSDEHRLMRELHVLVY